MKLLKIKNRTLRRVAMVVVFVPVVFEYLYIGLRSLYFDTKMCWSYEYPCSSSTPTT